MVALQGEQATAISHLVNGGPGISLDGVDLLWPASGEGVGLAEASSLGVAGEMGADCGQSAAAAASTEVACEPATADALGINLEHMAVDNEMRAAAACLLAVLDLGIKAMPGRDGPDYYVSGRHSQAPLPASLAAVVRKAIEAVANAEPGRQVVVGVQPVEASDDPPANS